MHHKFESSPLVPPTAQSRISYGLHNRLCPFSIKWASNDGNALGRWKKIKEKRKRKFEFGGDFGLGFGLGLVWVSVRSTGLSLIQFN